MHDGCPLLISFWFLYPSPMGAECQGGDGVFRSSTAIAAPQCCRIMLLPRWLDFVFICSRFHRFGWAIRPTPSGGVWLFANSQPSGDRRNHQSQPQQTGRKCYECGSSEHLRNQCPKQTAAGVFSSRGLAVQDGWVSWFDSGNVTELS